MFKKDDIPIFYKEGQKIEIISLHSIVASLFEEDYNYIIMDGYVISIRFEDKYVKLKEKISLRDFEKFKETYSMIMSSEVEYAEGEVNYV